MNELTVENIQIYENFSDMIESQCVDIFNYYDKVFELENHYYVDCEIFHQYIEISYEHKRWNDDCGFFKIPIEDFCGNWKQWVDNELKKEQTRVEAYQKIVTERELKEKEKNEYKMYLKLKEKYEKG